MIKISSLVIILVCIIFNICYAEETIVSQEECMQLCLSRINNCFGEIEQANQMCEESFCSAAISSESRDCLRDTLCDTFGSSIANKISICGIPRSP